MVSYRLVVHGLVGASTFNELAAAELRKDDVWCHVSSMGRVWSLISLAGLGRPNPPKRDFR
jgi:hypothetical protein